MIGTLCRRLLALALVLAAAAGGAQAQAPAAIWSGTSAGFDVQWTTGDIVVRRGKQAVFSARDWAQAGLAHFIDVNRDTKSARPPDCTLTRSLRIVALVGAMMSLEDSSENTCRREAHPGGMTRLLTVDLAKPGSLAQAGRDAIGRVDPDQPGRAVLLTDLFAAGDVLAGLAAAPPLRDVLRRAKSTPTTLPALIEAVAYASGEGDGCYSVPPDLLAGFAFARLDGDRIVMRLGLPGDGPCRMSLTTADMPFALPASLAPAARKAAARQEGFLADQAEAIAAGRRTVIELHSGRGAGR